MFNFIEMKKCVILILLSISWTQVCGQQFSLDTLYFSGPSEKRINYIILGDGYLESQLDKFKTDAQGVLISLFNTSPFKEYESHFNVFSIPVASNEEGAAEDPSALIDNYFGSTFNYAGIQRLLVPVFGNKVVEVLASTFPTYDQVLMLVNTTEYGGSGGWIATSSVHPSASEISIHEIGHSFADLADEYWAGPQYAAEKPNMTQTSTPAGVKWKNWLNNLGIGIYAFDENPTWYRPHNNCKMRLLGVDFCAVCKEQFVVTIQGITNPVEDYTPSFTQGSFENPLTFNLDLLRPFPDKLSINWFLNEQRLEEETNLLVVNTEQFDEETALLKAVIFDKTTLNRRDFVYLTTVEWTINGDIESSVRTELTQRPQNEEVLSTKKTKPQSEIHFYPNPVKNSAIVSFELKEISSVHIKISDLVGKTISEHLTTDMQIGTHQLDFDFSTFKNGMYIVTISTVGMKNSLKFVKVN
jgi:hypothetical protein